ncbi:hypothetical protein FHT86_000729 [Rhizobium sp. BK313]|nr:hypothetical protein [Rhizobium sp. BK313]
MPETIAAKICGAGGTLATVATSRPLIHASPAESDW